MTAQATECLATATAQFGSAAILACVISGLLMSRRVPARHKCLELVKLGAALSNRKARRLFRTSSILSGGLRGLSLLNESDTHFRYRLIGLHDEWVERGSGCQLSESGAGQIPIRGSRALARAARQRCCGILVRGCYPHGGRLVVPRISGVRGTDRSSRHVDVAIAAAQRAPEELELAVEKRTIQLREERAL